MATRWHSLLAFTILLVACSDNDLPQQSIAQTQCQADVESLREAENRAALLKTERDELQARLERVTLELVEVKVERDKMAVELRAYSRMQGSNGKTYTQDITKK